jgi:hypothetical protein
VCKLVDHSSRVCARQLRSLFRCCTLDTHYTHYLRTSLRVGCCVSVCLCDNNLTHTTLRGCVWTISRTLHCHIYHALSHNTYYTLHTTYYILHTTHFTLHTTQYIPTLADMASTEAKSGGNDMSDRCVIVHVSVCVCV